MSYYISNNKQELDEYNAYVSAKIGLTDPYGWSNVIEHKDGGQFAILKHEVHTSETLTELASLDGWFEIDIV